MMLPAGLFRRVAAMLYDGLLLLALWFLATAIALPINGGEAFTADNHYYHAYLLVISFLFYGWFWTHGGQTLGLKAWKLKVLTQNRQTLNWSLALLRFSTALLSWAVLGLGFLWILIDKKRLAWHDRLSKTVVFFQKDQ